jgi:uncharacterized protein (UPF0216 family)
MTERVDGADPLARWMALEMSKLRETLVAAPRSLSELMLEARPVAKTRGGGEHVFDASVVARFANALTALDRRKLRLPVTFFVEHEMQNDAYVTDATVVRLLQALGEIPASQELREGRLWLGHARARAIADRYPTAFQFAHL